MHGNTDADQLHVFVVVQEPRGQFKDLLVLGLRRTMLLLWLLWFAVAAVYYGIILSQSEILERGGMCAGTEYEFIFTRTFPY